MLNVHKYPAGETEKYKTDSLFAKLYNRRVKASNTERKKKRSTIAINSSELQTKGGEKSAKTIESKHGPLVRGPP
jgi:hypothetical protein